MRLSRKRKRVSKSLLKLAERSSWPNLERRYPGFSNRMSALASTLMKAFDRNINDLGGPDNRSAGFSIRRRLSFLAQRVSWILANFCTNQGKMMPRSTARDFWPKPISLLFLVVSAVGIEPTTY
jgi:hypothetical protein